MAEKGNIILYTTPDGVSKIEVTLQEDTVWLTLDQMAELFQRNKSTISRHIKNIFDEGELDENSVVAKNATTTQHGAIQGKNKRIEHIRPEGAITQSTGQHPVFARLSDIRPERAKANCCKKCNGSISIQQ